jgi:hypothetical protein
MNNEPSTLVPAPEVPGLDRGKRMAVLVSLAMVGAVLWPIQQNWRKNPKDNFPLSYYPMFSAKREAIEDFWYAVGRDAEDKRYFVPYTWIGVGGGNQVRRQLRRITNEGRAPELAKSIAKRVGRRDSPPWSQVVSVAVVRGQYSVDDFFHGKKEPVSEKINGFANVERKKTP